MGSDGCDLLDKLTYYDPRRFLETKGQKRGGMVRGELNERNPQASDNAVGFKPPLRIEAQCQWNWRVFRCFLESELPEQGVHCGGILPFCFFWKNKVDEIESFM